ncbi:hypothetical protein FRC17_002919 [Serendipita sp. 399]|nr:hypothetical protein FRC17_002919 [Serendipita sp. 399]
MADDNDMEMEMGTPPPISRSLEIALGDQEVITIDLDSLDQSTDDVIAVLQDAQCQVSIWTQLASEYWRRGWLESAQRITHFAVEWDRESLAPVYLLLANIQIDSSRAAPKMKLESAELDVLGNALLKDVYLSEATALMNHAGAFQSSADLSFLTRGIHQLARHSTINEALSTFQDILQAKPTNVVALHGKARILYMQRKYREALQIYQRILRLSPNARPDPRIGIGLCLWQLGEKQKAKRAWERCLELALKLAERAIQFADSLTVLSEGHLRAGRVAHLEERYDDAINHYNHAKNLPLASIGIAQCHIKRGETAAAIHVLDTMLSGPESQHTTEAIIMLASLRASERAGLSSSESAADKVKARELYERVKKSAAPQTNGASKMINGATPPVKKAAWMHDMEMHLELARLWEMEDLQKALSAYQDARSISVSTPKGVDPRIVNNIAVLVHLENNLNEARSLYEESLGLVSTTWAADEQMDAMSTTVLYNLARIYEDQGEMSTAKEAYEKLLQRHPEYIDGE